MSTLTLKDKPDLLFNNPLKQKVYMFLKNNPGRDFETFQVLTGDSAVSRQHFNEVEQAIKAREERDRVRPAARDLGALFLHGAPFDKPKAGFPGLGFSEKTEAKEFPLKKIEKKKMNERAKQYIKDNPGCTYDELVQNLGFKELSKPHFFSMKTLLRKKGLIPEESRTRRGRKAGDKSTSVVSGRNGASESSQVISFANMKTIEILDSIDATGFSDEIREHYKSHVLPMLQKLMPQGQKLQIVFLTDPPTIELRRIVIR